LFSSRKYFLTPDSKVLALGRTADYLLRTHLLTFIRKSDKTVAIFDRKGIGVMEQGAGDQGTKFGGKAR